MTSLAASTYTVFATVLGTRYELSVTTRIGSYARFADNNQAVSPEQLAGMAAHTIATWQRVIEAVMNGSFEIAPFLDKAWPSAQEKQGVVIEESEPFVTVWNKEGNSKGLGVTVHSWDNGTTALFTAYSMLQGIEKLTPYADKFGIEKLEYAPFPAIKAPTSPTPPAQAPKPASPDKNDVDAWLKNESDKAGKPSNPSTPATSVESTLPFRRFKQLAENIIQVQEFKQGGGGDKYQKSAIKATLPFHKTNVQYEDDSLVYYPITDAITIVEGQFGTQAVIPTANGRVYVSKDNKNGEETPDWHNFAQDLHDNYEPLLNDDIHNLFAPACVLVMKTGKQSDNKQYKNYYHIYQPLKD